VALSLLLSASVAAEPPPNGAANTGAVPGQCGAAQPSAGTLIDANNVGRSDCYLPAAIIGAVKHGFKIRIVGTHRLEWSKGFKHATEEYSPQVHLDAEDNLANYIAGMPFPLVIYVWLGAEFFESDPKTKITEIQEMAAPLWRTPPAPGRIVASGS
jgi:hypothetical protein